MPYDVANPNSWPGGSFDVLEPKRLAISCRRRRTHKTFVGVSHKYEDLGRTLHRHPPLVETKDPIHSGANGLERNLTLIIGVSKVVSR